MVSLLHDKKGFRNIIHHVLQVYAITTTIRVSKRTSSQKILGDDISDKKTNINDFRNPLYKTLLCL